MKRLKKFISKKRKNKFKIEKSSNQKININHFFTNNNGLYEANQPFITQNNETNVNLNNPNLDEEEDDLNNRGHSLKEISKLIIEFIKQNKVTTLNQVNEYIINVYKPKNPNGFFKKNINVAIEVMRSIGRIKINNQIIQYIDYNIKENNSKNKKIIKITKNNEKNEDNEEEEDDNNYDKNVENDKHNDFYKEEINKKSKQLKELQEILIKKYFILQFVEKFVGKQNKENEKNNNNNIQFSPDELKYNNNFSLKTEVEDKQSSCLSSDNSEFKLYDIIKQLIRPEILSKLNENNSMNNSDNLDITKDNSLKVTNGDSLLDILSNTNSDKEQIIKEKLINSDNNININKNDKIFNYLKNLKLFKVELYSDNKDDNINKNIK